MSNIIITEHLKNHKNFKRVKNTGYNNSFYFSTVKGNNLNVEAMIGISSDCKDMMWRFSIFKNGIIESSYNSLNHGIEDVDVWFKTLIIEVFNLTKEKSSQ